MTCTFDECDRPVKALGLCNGHYQQKWAGQELRPLQIRSSCGRKCSARDCGRPHESNGFCKMHAHRVRRHGDPAVKLRDGGPMRGNVPTSPAIHTRLQKQRGRAADYACIDCGGQAEEWSYNNAGSDEHTYVDHGHEVRYSTNLDDYDPRCRSCHRRFDAAARAGIAPTPAGDAPSPRVPASPSAESPAGSPTS